MKQFQKYGVAAAIASVAAGTVAQNLTETGDLAIVPYYTVKNGFNTGVHVINTTASTQVVKVRLRRAVDSKDAMDFNVILSPFDEWTANIGEGGANGVKVTTGDKSCTVPQFPNGVGEMPATFAEGATEGYVEIIGMAQVADEDDPLAVGAKHVDGVPVNCDAVELNFYRVDDLVTSVGNTDLSGTHRSDLTNAACNTATATDYASLASCAVAAENTALLPLFGLTEYDQTDDNALKVSFMLTDSDGGLEAGDNAVHMAGFSSIAMMTNQEELVFNAAGRLEYDPLNFEMPNLGVGAWVSDIAARNTASAGVRGGELWNGFAGAMDADAIANDWASIDAGESRVDADWIVTLPGQYAMVNTMCDNYAAYADANPTALAGCLTATNTGDDQNQLPLILAGNLAGEVLIAGSSNLALWDREEDVLLSPDDQQVTCPGGGINFSPSATDCDPENPEIELTLDNEVNVITWGAADDGGVLNSNVAVHVEPEGADRGWGRLNIVSSNDDPQIWIVDGPGTAVTDANPIVPAAELTADPDVDVDDANEVPVVGFAVWSRQFAGQAGAGYGRMVEHSNVAASSATE